MENLADSLLPARRTANGTRTLPMMSLVGRIVERVALLGEFVEGNEAMLVYDMSVTGLGMLRVAEQFTVGDGKITRLRQIHDTTPVRAAGVAREREPNLDGRSPARHMGVIALAAISAVRFFPSTKG